MKFTLDYKDTHLKIIADGNLKDIARDEVFRQYKLLEAYMQKNPVFMISYEPLAVDNSAPEIVKLMAEAAKKTGVGPSAAVAGAFAELVGKELLKHSSEIVVENGGDIFLKLKKEKTIGIHAGQSKFSNKLAFSVRPEETPLGICTSSASVGHSISLGESDAVTVVAKSATLADATATAIGNEVKGKHGMEKGIEKAKKISGVRGVLIIHKNKLGTFGKLPELVEADFEV